MEYQEALDLLVLHHDVYSYILCFGSILGIFVSSIIFSKYKSTNQATIFLGISVFSFSVVIGDLFLGYTNLMKYCVHLNDTTEVLVLTGILFIYLTINSIIRKRKYSFKELFPHFIIPLLYFFYQWFYFLQPREVKLNAHIGAFRRGIVPFVQYETKWDMDPLGLKEHFRELLVSFAVFYLVLTIVRFFKAFKKKEIRWVNLKKHSKFQLTYNLIAFFCLMIVILFTVYLQNETDTGDHFIGIFIIIMIAFITWFIIGESRIFNQSWLAEKYETVKISEDHDVVISKLNQLLKEELFYLDPDCNLKSLSEKLNVPTHYLSQSINKTYQRNFNDYINQLRINVAKERLLNPDFKKMSIDGIGQSAGFKSKSTFYTAFKKYTQLTPKQYLKKYSSKS